MAFHRQIHTTQELRANQDGQWIEDQGDYRIKIRGRRNNIPNSWDDLMRSDLRHKCWKRHRMTQ
jgi:hypothetical protein